MLSVACANAKLPQWRMHDFRRSFATRCFRAGVPLTTIRDWLGHKDEQTTMRYVGVYRADADVRVPPSSALAALQPPPANVLPLVASGAVSDASDGCLRKLVRKTYEMGGFGGLLGAPPAHSVSAVVPAKIAAPPIRIERTTNGLGNRPAAVVSLRDRLLISDAERIGERTAARKRGPR